MSDDAPIVPPFCDARTRMTAQEADVQLGGDGCCHKTRLLQSACPIGWTCPYIKTPNSHAPEMIA